LLHLTWHLPMEDSFTYPFDLTFTYGRQFHISIWLDIYLWKTVSHIHLTWHLPMEDSFTYPFDWTFTYRSLKWYAIFLTCVVTLLIDCEAKFLAALPRPTSCCLNSKLIGKPGWSSSCPMIKIKFSSIISGGIYNKH
jgi:hypothetical protein